MEVWSQDMVDLVEEAYFHFNEDDQGQFTFCAVEGDMDIVVNTRIPELEFSWEGTDDAKHVSGRGKIEFLSPFEGEGIIYIHNGDRSAFSIKRKEQSVPDNVVKFR
ncbi:hypothetical protein ESZ39_07770 [Colwellia sp. C1TZA3]|nr:hypothetical protein ESZ39_07770 [Colwellia sp. C1TZA3]